MGARGMTLGLALGLVACTPPSAHPSPPTRGELAARVAADFERATLTSKDAYVALFDFAAVGEYEILLRRYNLRDPDVNLTADQRVRFACDDGTPFPPARERRNVGNFYPLLAQRTVGTGGCVAGEPRSHYGQTLGEHFAPLPACTPPKYEQLRTDANYWLDHGGVVGITCTGGEDGIAVVYTAAPNQRGYNLITIYDD